MGRRGCFSVICEAISDDCDDCAGGCKRRGEAAVCQMLEVAIEYRGTNRDGGELVGTSESLNRG